ncbi:EF-hand domain-containing protein [Caulobacter sp. S45]|uniref:EF-hand domain-containing protein n=1 Tax=Caulobacter sp. S45 TaxID=1641861 RepID=UPI0015757C75|nr:EF-hand domain-containing protein [Caulobacter sp. S45]
MRKTRVSICAVVLATGAMGCSKHQADVAPASGPAATVTPATPAAPPLATSPAVAPAQVAPGGLAEFQARFQKNVMRADVDHDGRISQQEWVTFRTARPGRGGDPAKQFARLDTNHDGYLTADELDAASSRIFARRSAMQASAPNKGGDEVN